MPLIGASPLAIPENGDTSRAWQETFDPADPAINTDVSRVIPGETFEQFLNGRILFTTSAAAGNRLMQLEILDGNGRIQGQYPALNTQGPGIVGGYSFVTGAAQPYAAAFNVQVVPLPPLLLFPTWTIIFDMAGAAAGDKLSAVSFTMLRIPTGSAPPPAEIVLPTPLLV